jgi:hypothetical protein
VTPRRCDALQVVVVPGTPFGSAYYDSCERCVGGQSGNAPKNNCDEGNVYRHSSSPFQFMAEMVLLIILVCCMSFFLSAMSYLIRGALVRRGILIRNELQLEREDLGLQLNNHRNQRNRLGLSAFEIDSLGVIIFNQKFKCQYNSKQACQNSSSHVNKSSEYSETAATRNLDMVYEYHDVNDSNKSEPIRPTNDSMVMVRSPVIC